MRLFNKKRSPFDIKPDPKLGLLTPEFFASLKLQTKTIIDVGVARGTDWLYTAFHDCDFVLVDPIPEFQNDLRDPPKSYTAVNLGLGSAPGKLTLDLRGPRSTVHQWQSTVPKKSEGVVDVEIDTLDNVIAKYAPTGKIGLKIDTEGHEVEVLRGLDEHADRIEFMICESSIRRRFEDDYRFSDLIAEAARKGFQLYNFVSMQQARPTHYDCMFLREDDRRFDLGGIK